MIFKPHGYQSFCIRKILEIKKLAILVEKAPGNGSFFVLSP